MNTKSILAAAAIACTVCLLAACRRTSDGHEPLAPTATHDPGTPQNPESATTAPTPDDHSPGIYYWKTRFRLTAWDSTFVARHGIRRLYLRLFDVDYAMEGDGRMHSIPIATTRFESPIPDGMEVVPVVYITQQAIAHDARFAPQLYSRIRAMAVRHGFARFREVQLDCDWTQTTQEAFFGLCRDVADLARADSVTVSATIRLHQLRTAPPPVARGVLMLYNTGSLYDAGATNSILSLKDVEPYLRSDVRYGLPLTAAYPAYGWGIWLRGGKFMAILHCTDYGAADLYQPDGARRYTVRRTHYLEGHRLEAGDVIRLEQSDLDEILNVKRLVGQRLEGLAAGSVIYHLDSLNLSRFTAGEVTQILQ